MTAKSAAVETLAKPSEHPLQEVKHHHDDYRQQPTIHVHYLLIDLQIRHSKISAGLSTSLTTPESFTRMVKTYSGGQFTHTH
jgi:hypothetical protein